MLCKSLLCKHPWKITESLCTHWGMQRGACNQPSGSSEVCDEDVYRGVCNEGCVTSQRVLLQRSATRSASDVRRGSVTDPANKLSAIYHTSIDETPSNCSYLIEGLSFDIMTMTYDDSDVFRQGLSRMGQQLALIATGKGLWTCPFPAQRSLFLRIPLFGWF